MKSSGRNTILGKKRTTQSAEIGRTIVNVAKNARRTLLKTISAVKMSKYAQLHSSNATAYLFCRVCRLCLSICFCVTVKYRRLLQSLPANSTCSCWEWRMKSSVHIDPPTQRAAAVMHGRSYTDQLVWPRDNVTNLIYMYYEILLNVANCWQSSCFPSYKFNI